MPLKFIVVSVLAAFMLVGCSSEPSSADIQKALQLQVNGQRETARAWMGEQAASLLSGFLPQIKSAEKLGCVKVHEKSYTCDVEIELYTNDAKTATRKATDKVTLLKGSDGWVVSR